MKPKALTIITGAVIAIAAICVVGLFVSQQLEISAATTRYNTLFGQYVASVKDCAKANDCTSTVPAPSTIVEQGAPGTNGTNGQNATDDQVQRAVDLYCDIRVDCQGPPGVDGADGSTGVAGANGVNGTNGVDGATGPAGPQGADGADGQPPTSWTYLDVFGTSHDCTRTDPFDPANPTYQCN